MISDQFPAQQKQFFLNGPVGQLEVLTTWPKQRQTQGTMVICHPHPLYEGTMHNKVVFTLAKAFDQLGLATVRFNYRGVGQSEGQYGQMIGEIEDLKAIITWVQSVLPQDDIWLAGFSFGSFISASVANQINAKYLVNIAPAVNHADFSNLKNISCPWLVIQGDQDDVVPYDEVIHFAKYPPAALQLITMQNVGHYFSGHLITLRELIIKQLKPEIHSN